MFIGILHAAGGLGLFLLGMVVMTEGLRAVAGDALRRVLARFTTSPLSGAVTGAATTAIVQSSSATTVAAVGFVGAGLLTFPQGLGVILGANVGTTATGWIVALLGFRLNLGTVVLPVILVGVLLRLFGRGRTAAAGYALAGFGLIFVGIASLQQGMAGLEGFVTPGSLPAATLLGRLQLVGIGLVVTVITQSSSAGVATALVALHVGAISLPQGAALVIGMDVGTTVTAALATIGGSTAARRTGYAHVLYNLLAASWGLLLLVPYVAAVERLAPALLAESPEIALVAFHTGYETLSVMLVVPFAGRFAQLLERLIPERLSPFARRLDASLLRDPDIALDALTATLRDLVQKVFSEMCGLLRRGRADAGFAERLALLSLALSETRRYVERLETSAESPRTYGRHVSAIHVIDHLGRVVDRCRETQRVGALGADPPLAEAAHRVLEAGDHTDAWLRAGAGDPPEAGLEEAWRSLKELKEPNRERVLERAATGLLAAGSALEQLDAMRWLQRVTYHAWRIVHHLHRCHFDVAVSEAAEPAPHAEPESPE